MDHVVLCDEVSLVWTSIEFPNPGEARLNSSHSIEPPKSDYRRFYYYKLSSEHL